MSRAEIKAHEIFSSMQLNDIDDEVRRHLMILLLTVPKKENIMPYTSDELLRHLDESNSAIENGNVYSMEEANNVMDNILNSI